MLNTCIYIFNQYNIRLREGNSHQDKWFQVCEEIPKYVCQNTHEYLGELDFIGGLTIKTSRGLTHRNSVKKLDLISSSSYSYVKIPDLHCVVGPVQVEGCTHIELIS